MSSPLHEQQPTSRFSDRAADYVRFRPTYPPEAIDAILVGLGNPRELLAADVGAGTGISARLLAGPGVRVIAIEPNAAMRAEGERSNPLAQGGGLSNPRQPPSVGGPESPTPCEGGTIEWRAGTAEATGLDDASVDLVLCAQSYHWFEPPAACLEFGRILKPGGRLALMWNDGDETDPVAKGYYDLVREASTGAGPSSHQTVAKDPRVEPPFDATRMKRLRFRNEQRLDADGLIGRAMSASYVVKEGEKAERLVAGLRRLHAERAGADGCVGLVYGVWVYLVELGTDGGRA